MDPTLVVLVSSALAAGAAALGPLPLAGHARPPSLALGWANALAAGLMLGPAYLLMRAGMAFDPIQGASGALLGIGFVWYTHFAAGTDEMDLNSREERSPVYGYQVMLVNALHSAWEGVAIGVSFGVGLPFGSFVVAAMAVHNVPESTVLASILKARGARSGQAAALGVVTNVPQILLAVVTFALVRAAPAILPWCIGFAVGSLVYLVLSELMPQSYLQAGRRTMALVTIVAMGIVVLLAGVAA